MKVLHVSKFSDVGGAAKAAHNIHLSLKSVGIDSIFAVDVTSENDDVDTTTLGAFYTSKVVSFLRLKFSNILLLLSSLRSQRSCNIIPTPWPKKINNSDCDVVMIHWVGGGGLSIFDLSKINKKIIWVMHDMWIFCGAEHLSTDARFINGYSRSNKPSNNKLLDIDKFIWKRKKHIISKLKNITFIAPSEWMCEQALNSQMIHYHNICTVNIPIDTSYWKSSSSEKSLNEVANVDLTSKFVLTFGSSSGATDKGMLIFTKAVELLPEFIKQDLYLVFFGATDKLDIRSLSVPAINFGYVKSKNKLRQIISISDVCVYPSRIESFGQLAAETALCGTPVIAYKHSGVSDFIESGINGILFEKYTEKCIAQAIYDAHALFFNLGVDSRLNHKLINALNFENIGNKYKKIISKL